ncbi:MAG: CBS domain-containing protein [Pyrinomonadaceae bacterium]
MEGMTTRVKDLMTENPAVCTPKSWLTDVAKLMVDNDCGCIPVVDSVENMKPVGAITDRDITIRTVAVGRNPLELTAGDCMTNAAESVTPETSIEECCDLMEQHQLRRILVVDETGKCCGIVAQADIAKYAPAQTAEVVQEVSA